ncbi:hypothetical protein HK100_003775 [Physocladia obscura]|uniref:DUF1565 domain-containing protein n=1 Tax=Physocladia obscura TaxID=109957 RepID=A0AAD5XL39_9FUNG|nr:hypothetical protein HK100_003775 [Physocladia obscura]
MFLWVSPNGSDSGSGSMESPFKTISYALQKAVPAPSTINILPGLYSELVKITSSLYSGITLQGHATIPSTETVSRLLIAQPNELTQVPGSESWSNENMVIVKGFYIGGNTRTFELRNITISNTDPGIGGLSINGKQAAVDVHNCIITRNIGDGIQYFAGTHFNLTNSFVTFNNQRSESQGSSRADFQGNGLLCQAPNAYIKNCLFAFNGDNKFKHGIYNNVSATNMVVLENAFFENSSAGFKIGGSGFAKNNYISHSGKNQTVTNNNDCAGFVFGHMTDAPFVVSENIVDTSDKSTFFNAVRQLSECDSYVSSVQIDNNCYHQALGFLASRQGAGYITGPRLTFEQWKSLPYEPDKTSTMSDDCLHGPVKVFPFME